MEELIKRYDLSPHPEGGYFKEVYRSALKVVSPETGSPRHAVTQIYFLLAAGQVSRFHRVAHDEIWHFYEGAPLTLIRYDGKTVSSRIIGPGEDYTAVIPGNVWQAAESTGAYTLVGCTVAPGFDFSDFSFFDEKEAEAFKAGYKGYERFI
ncbi:MAG: cupin domain-containing protein [Desulfobacterales bacterium]|nr:cupin domain-containing protein [Desulfobacterales bacterium]